MYASHFFLVLHLDFPAMPDPFHMHAIIYSQLVAAANDMVHCITVKVATQIVYINTAIIVTSLSTSAPAQAN